MTTIQIVNGTVVHIVKASDINPLQTSPLSSPTISPASRQPPHTLTPQSHLEGQFLREYTKKKLCAFHLELGEKRFPCPSPTTLGRAVTDVVCKAIAGIENRFLAVGLGSGGKGERILTFEDEFRAVIVRSRESSALPSPPNNSAVCRRVFVSFVDR